MSELYNQSNQFACYLQDAKTVSIRENPLPYRKPLVCNPYGFPYSAHRRASADVSRRELLANAEFASTPWFLWIEALMPHDGFSPA